LVHPSCSTFSNPSTPERRAYACFWQNKLAFNNKTDVSLQDTALDAFAEETDGFSFAYLKEALSVASQSFFRFSGSFIFVSRMAHTVPLSALT
jgi:hypothetical protein